MPLPSAPSPRPLVHPRTQPRLRVPWPPALSKEELLRGLSYYGSGLRLQRVAAKLLAGQPIKVYMLGGSVTGGGGATAPDLAYAARFFHFINASFPHRSVAASWADRRVLEQVGHMCVAASCWHAKLRHVA